MTHDVFISHTSADRPYANRLVAALEQSGLRCWVAPRDIAPGEAWGRAIVEAIGGCPLLVLVFSDATNESPHVQREVERASERGLRIIPFRIDAAVPRGALEFFLSSFQWLDGFDCPFEEAAARLLAAIRKSLPSAGAAAAARPDAAREGAPTLPLSAGLPEQLNAILGRAPELAELAALLEQHRAVTIVGGGGLGKTRLALEVAVRAQASFKDGVWYLELAPLESPELIAETLAALMNVPAAGGAATVDALVQYLRRHETLLVIDNCEHLLAGAADLANRLVASCPGVRVLATSGQPLSLKGEQVFRLDPLAVPPAGEITADEACRYGAVALFVERARAALGRFEVTDAEASTIAAICRRLEGIALAIELAVPRLKILSPAKMLKLLDDKFKLLTSSSTTVLPRQRTLGALFDWSYNLLDQRERLLLRRLTVFAGSWSTESAQTVCADETLEVWDILDLLDSLVDKSLVVAERRDGAPRFRFLEPIREYLAAKRSQAGDPPGEARLARYLVEILVPADREREVTPSALWLERWGDELENVRASVSWAFGPEGDPPLGVALVALGRGLWIDSHLTVEHRRLRDMAVGHLTPETPPEIASRLYSAAGRAAGRPADSEKAVALARASGDKLLLGQALLGQARLLLNEAGVQRAKPILAEALEIASHANRPKLLARVLLSLGMAASIEGSAAARGYYDRSLAAAEKAGDLQILYTAFGNIAELLYSAGAVDEAIEVAEQAIASARKAGDRWIECLLRNNAGAYLIASGKMERGAAEAGRALSEALLVGEESIAVLALQHLTLALAHAGELERAAVLQAFVDAQVEALGITFDQTEIAARARVRLLLGEGEVTARPSIGGLTFEDAAAMVRLPKRELRALASASC